MALVRRIGDHQRGEHQHQALRGKQVDQRQDAPLREHREREQQKQRCEQVDQLCVERQIHVYSVLRAESCQDLVLVIVPAGNG